MSKVVCLTADLSAPLSKAELRALDVLWYAIMGSDRDVRRKTYITDARIWYKVNDRNVAIDMAAALAFPRFCVMNDGALKHRNDPIVQAMMRKLEEDGLGKFSYLIVALGSKVRGPRFIKA